MTRESVRPWQGRWITTADAARMLQLTRWGVHKLVKRGVLSCERTPAGWRVFAVPLVARVVEERAKQRLQPRAWRPRVLVGRKGEPRQLELFSPLTERRMAKGAVNTCRAKPLELVRKRA